MTSYISEKLITSEFDNPNVHLKKIIDSVQENVITIGIKNIDFNMYIFTYKIIIDFCKEYEIKFSFPNANTINDKNNIVPILHKLNTYLLLETDAYSIKHLFQKKHFQLNDEEYETIQERINKLRDLITKSSDFNEEHRRRLLKKLEEMQNELNKKMATWDFFLGRMVSFSHSLGLSAKEAKPFTDELKEIGKIAIKSKSEGEDLPNVDNQLGTDTILQIENQEE